MKKVSLMITALLLLSLVGFSQPIIIPAPGNYTVCPGEGIIYSPNPDNVGCGTFTWTVTKGSFTFGSSTTTTTTSDATKSVTVYWNDVADTGTLSYSTTCNGTPVSVTKSYAIKSLTGRTPANARIAQGQQFPFCNTGGITLATDVMFLLNTGGATGITQQRADGYEWVLPAGWSSSGATGTITTSAEMINIEPANGCSGGTATVKAFMNCGSGRKYSNSASISLARPTPSITLSPPAGYAGPSCGATNPITFTVTPISCASDYRWVFPSGWAGSAPSPVSTGTNNSITLTPGGTTADAGNITVTITLNCGTQFERTIPLAFQAPVISSPALVCSSGSQVTLQNVSGSIVVNWSVSANMVINSGQGTNTITVGPLNSASDGSGLISATTNCANTTVPNKSLWIGKPVYQQFTFDGNMVPVVCEGLYQSFSGGAHVMTAIPGGTTSSPTFTLQTSSPYVTATPSGNNYNISVSTKNQNFEFLVHTSVSNGCGTKQTCTYFTNWATIVANPYPNPAVNETKVDVGSPGTKKNVTLYNSKQETVFTTVTTENSISIDTSTLPNGAYIVKVIEEGKSSSKRLIVKH